MKTLIRSGTSLLEESSTCKAIDGSFCQGSWSDLKWSKPMLRSCISQYSLWSRSSEGSVVLLMHLTDIATLLVELCYRNCVSFTDLFKLCSCIWVLKLVVWYIWGLFVIGSIHCKRACLWQLAAFSKEFTNALLVTF